VEYRTVGMSGLKVSRLVLGGGHIGSGVIDEARGRELVDAAFDHGINSFYTADVYPVGSYGGAQEILGKALKPRRREDFVLINKIGIRFGPGAWPIRVDRKQDHIQVPTAGVWPSTSDLSRKHLTHALDASLKRLQMDYVDVLSAHGWDPSTPLEETLETLDGFVRAGKALHIGCAYGWAAWHVHYAHRISEKSGLAKIRAFQTEYNLLNRWPEREQLPACEAAGVGVFAFNSLAGNFLTGELDTEKLKEWAGPTPGRQRHTTDYANDECLIRAKELIKVAKECGRSPGELAQGWVLSHSAVTALDIGPTEPAELEPMVKAVDKPPSRDELQAVEERVAMQAPPSGTTTAPKWHLI
jgi:1-deoxyxylulose-5-phosphate synthase